ncbi:MAG: hypothetical protein II574_00710, partial [Ruminococcus sp.]|nr:hypothetical protein [Ruminococcus sp.]
VLSFLVCVTPLFLLNDSGNVLICASVLNKMYNGISSMVFVFVFCVKMITICFASGTMWCKSS